jgi:hypothetical protein
VLLAVAAVWVWKAVGLVILAFALLLWLVMKLWGEAGELSEASSLEAAMADTAMALEGELAEAENLRESLERKLSAPSMGLGAFLHALDDQTARLELVEKHRVLHKEGLGEFLVSAISSDGADGLIVRAHVNETPTLALGEECVLIQRVTAGLVGVGRVSSSSTSTMIQVPIGSDRINDGADYGELPSEPDAFVLKLSGLWMEPYKDLSDGTINEALDAIRHLAKSISENLTTDLNDEGGQA